MAHKIEKRDTVYLAAIPELFDGKGWHGLGITPKAFDEKELASVLFEHSVSPAGILLPNGKFHPTGELYASSLDDGLPIGTTVSDRWARPTNKKLFVLFRDALAGSDYEIVSCGTVEDRIQFFVDAKAKKTAKAAGRDVANFFGLHSGYGGKTSTVFSGHAQVIQCSNTTALFLAEAMKNEGVIRAKNTTNVLDKLPGIQKAIELQIGVAGEFVRALESAAKIKVVDVRTAKQAYVGLLGTVSGVPITELSTRSANRANRMAELFLSGKGNGGENVADFYSGATDYFTHESATSEDEEKKDEFNQKRRAKQWFSSEFGTARNTKTELHKFLFGDLKNVKNAFGKLRETGEKIIGECKDKDTLALLAV